MPSRWKAGAAAVALGAAVVVGEFTPAVSHAAPPPAVKDFSKPAVVILGYGLKPNGTMMIRIVPNEASPAKTVVTTEGCVIASGLLIATSMAPATSPRSSAS